ncbi:hypothetical protein PRIPAC_95499 [Pristionchus pacificus]|uniref:G protein-coupled receptor n=1 Tax=Pristionchus pacificus TaxID=54126 RepID=A0A2A6B3G8_PRIPA|nr:hypothetical protein PRIPAC_95499 [Pristionchus pacificus]|eukprot:PDM60420.1 G protein-coupled receptor [Pristionchus pacificus]
MAVHIRFLTDSFDAPEYDCRHSAHTPEEWTELYGEQQTLIGVWSVVFSTMCQILYLPSLRVFYRERKLTCYKIMFLLALADYGCITGVGSLFGYALLKGYVMCSDFTLSLVMGLIICCCWYVSTGSCALLGWRSSLAMVIIVIYGMMVTLFTRLVYPNSPHTTVAFESFIPGHTVEEYPNNANMMHTFAVSFNRAQVSNTTQALQANVFYQASIICFFNVTTAAAWLIQMFVPTPQFIITAGMITIQSVHGNFQISNRMKMPFSCLPCNIYLVFNRSVRKELWKVLGVSGERAATAKSLADTFRVLTINQSITDLINCAICAFIIAPTILFSFHLPFEISARIGQLFMVAYDCCSWSHLLITLNRFTFIFFPFRYTSICSLRTTLLSVFSIWLLAICVSFYEFNFDDCHYYLANDSWNFDFEGGACEAVEWHINYLRDMIMTGCIALIDVLTLIKFRSYSRKDGSANTSSKKQKQECLLLTQAILQSTIFYTELLCCYNLGHYL